MCIRDSHVGVLSFDGRYLDCALLDTSLETFQQRSVLHLDTCLLYTSLAQKYNGKFNLRFDDTNPTKEKTEFVEAIKEDIKSVSYTHLDVYKRQIVDGIKRNSEETA